MRGEYINSKAAVATSRGGVRTQVSTMFTCDSHGVSDLVV